MLLQRQTKGYSLLKFLLSVYLFYQTFSNIYTLYTLYNVDGQLLQTIIYSLFLIVCLIAIFILNAHLMFYRFLLGIARYQWVREVDQSIYEKYRDVVVVAPTLQQVREKRYSNMEQTKLKRHQTMHENDFLESLRKTIEPSLPAPVNHRKIQKFFSLPTQNFQPQQPPKQKKTRSQYLTQLQQNYRKNLLHKNKIPQQQYRKILKCKNIIGTIFQNIANRQNNNIQSIKKKAEELFNVRVVDKVDKRDVQYGMWGKRMGNAEGEKRGYEEVQFEEIIGLDIEALWSGTFRFNSVVEENKQYRIQKMNELKRLIAELRDYDTKINMTQNYLNHAQRLQQLHRLQKIAKNSTENKSLYDSDNAAQQYEIQQLMIWILSEHLNGQTKNILSQAFIFRSRQTRQIDRLVYIRWVEAHVGTDCITHFDQIYQQHYVRNRGIQTFVCVPGQDNIASLLSMYLTLLGTQFRGQLAALPEIEKYVNQVLTVF